MHADARSREFSVAGPGGAADEWDAWARSAPRWNPAHTSLVVVAPHPDDETLGAGGLIFSCVLNRIPVTVISVTDGEAACPEVRDLGPIRRQELARAIGELGLHGAEVIALGLRDGHVQNDEKKLTQLLTGLVPAEATLIGPFELDGHPDHEATGRACLVAARECGVRSGRYPIWAWYRDAAELRSQRTACRFVLSNQAQCAKKRAIAQFQSQTRERQGGPVVPSYVLDYFHNPYEIFLF